MKRQTLTTAEVALWLEIPPNSVARWCRRHGVQPAHRVRVGRSFVTAWPISALLEATREPTQLDADLVCVLN